MSPQEVAQQHHQAFNDRSFYETAGQFVSTDCVMHNAGTGQDFHGIAGYIAFGEGWLGMMPDAHLTVLSQEVENEKVYSRFRGQGTFTGSLVSPQGTVPGNGRSLDLEFEETLEIKNGKIANGQLHFNMQEMMRQLGLA